MNMPHMITEIEIKEVSLVDHPANKRKFLLMKGDDTMSKLFELITTYCGAKIQFQKSDEGLIDALHTADKKILERAFKILNVYKDQIPDDLESAVLSLTELTTKLILERNASYNREQNAIDAEPKPKIEQIGDRAYITSKSDEEDLWPSWGPSDF